MQPTQLVALLALAACGNKADDHPPSAAATAITQASDWAKQPLATLTETLDDNDFGHHTFTVAIPQGLARHVIGHIGVSFGGLPDVVALRVDIGYDNQAKTLDDFVAQTVEMTKAAPDEIVRREQLAQGMFVVIHSHHAGELWAVRSQHAIDDHRAVTCYAQQRFAGRGALIDATRAMLENICQSLTVH
jgi:hypothetical protein